MTDLNEIGRRGDIASDKGQYFEKLKDATDDAWRRYYERGGAFIITANRRRKTDRKYRLAPVHDEGASWYQERTMMVIGDPQ